MYHFNNWSKNEKIVHEKKFMEYSTTMNTKKKKRKRNYMNFFHFYQMLRTRNVDPKEQF